MIIETQTVEDIAKLKSILTERDVRFFDFGCSHGQGMAWIQEKTGLRGLGFDIDRTKLAMADAQGVLCTAYDILNLTDSKLVSFTTIFHMLEHLGSREEACDIVRKACLTSRDAVFIKQPYYDSDSRLFHLGLKTFYSHWSGHRTHLTTPEFYHLLEDLRTKRIIQNYAIGYKRPITSSSDNKIHPLSSPRDSHEYDPAKHPPKPPHITFSFPLYYEIQIALDVGAGNYKPLWKHFAPDHIALDTRNGKRDDPHFRFPNI